MTKSSQRTAPNERQLPAPSGDWFTPHTKARAPGNWARGPGHTDELEAIRAALPAGHVVVVVTLADRAFARTSQEWQGFGGALCDDGGFLTTVTSFIHSVGTPHGAVTLRLARDRSITEECPSSLFDGADHVRTASEALYSGTEAALQHLLEADGIARVSTSPAHAEGPGTRRTPRR